MNIIEYKKMSETLQILFIQRPLVAKPFNLDPSSYFDSAPLSPPLRPIRLSSNEHSISTPSTIEC